MYVTILITIEMDAREYKNLMLIIYSCRFLKKIGNIKMDTYYDFFIWEEYEVGNYL